MIDIRWPGVWDSIKPYLDKAIDKTCFQDIGLDYVQQTVLSGQAQAWGLLRDGDLIGAGITSHRNLPLRRVLEVALFGAEDNSDEAWTTVWGDLAQYAKATGCAAVQFSGRIGWAKKMKSLGVPVVTKQTVEVVLDEGK